MKLVDGSPEAMKLINDLKKSGALIDVYSKEYFQKRDDDDFNPDLFDELLKEHGDEFENHLLIGCFHSDHSGMMSILDLVGITEDDNPILSYPNEPSFLIINLRTQAILYFGMFKRKAQTIEKVIYSTGKFSTDDFEDLDHLGVIDSIREYFEEVANGLRPTLDGLTEGELGELFKGKNGNFFREEEDAENVDKDDEYEGITQERIDERYSELKSAQDKREEGEYCLQRFFPEFSFDSMYG
jgi:hypothetical protein